MGVRGSRIVLGASVTLVSAVTWLHAESGGRVVCEYSVTAGAEARELRIETLFERGVGDVLVVDGDLSGFVQDLEVAVGDRWASVARQGAHFRSARCRRGCRIRYRFLLADAAQSRSDRYGALAARGVLLVPPSAWLLRPLRHTEGRYRLRVRTPPGIAFATGVFPARDGTPDTYEADVATLGDVPYTAFGAFETHRVQTKGGVVEIAVAAADWTTPRSALLRWVESSADSVASFYGSFPMPRVLVMVVAGRGRAVGYGTTLGQGGASILIWVSPTATAEELSKDWVLTHEMVHLGFPTLPRQHRWLEEGLATYVEPLARARTGRLPHENVWRGLVEGLPHGLPGPGDRGLDHTRSWGRTYWGGALFCFLADIEIRERTGNRRSLDDALRGIVSAGGNGGASWDIERTLAAGDRATGVPVLRELYERMGSAPAPVDLDAVWKRLGVAVREGAVVLDDSAPLAAVRRSLTAAGGAGS